MIERTCEMCGTTLEAEDIVSFGDAFVAHCSDVHADLPFPPEAIRNYGEGLARMTGSTERLPSIGAVEVHPVTADRLDDWLDLFDHDVFAGYPQWSACYCTEPHRFTGEEGSNLGTWQEKRAHMIERFGAGEVFGYLAYVDGRVAGWVNASSRCDYALFRRNDAEDEVTAGVSCFAISPPYRGHGIAKQLLDRVVADATSRGMQWVEAYPWNDAHDTPNFRGDRRMYDDRGFTEVKVRARDTVVRRPAP